MKYLTLHNERLLIIKCIIDFFFLDIYLGLKRAKQMTQIRVICSQCEDFAFDERTLDIVVLEHYVFFQTFHRVIVIGAFEFGQQYLK